MHAKLLTQSELSTLRKKYSDDSSEGFYKDAPRDIIKVLTAYSILQHAYQLLGGTLNDTHHGSA